MEIRDKFKATLHTFAFKKKKKERQKLVYVTAFFSAIRTLSSRQIILFFFVNVFFEILDFLILLSASHPTFPSNPVFP